MKLTMRGALVLFGLFAIQFLGPPLVGFLPVTAWTPDGDQAHVALSFVYMGLAAIMLLVNSLKVKPLCAGD
ncbi:MAG: hypothetical protein ABSE08_10255 [Syntrophobacteraceae bacterium]|jgi:hypothetical protein